MKGRRGYQPQLNRAALHPSMSSKACLQLATERGQLDLTAMRPAGSGMGTLTGTQAKGWGHATCRKETKRTIQGLVPDSLSAGVEPGAAQHGQCQRTTVKQGHSQKRLIDVRSSRDCVAGSQSPRWRWKKVLCASEPPYCSAGRHLVTLEKMQ